jgi:methylisocitrate lyase
MSHPAPASGPHPRTPAQTLRELIAARGCVAAPGSFSALCALAVRSAGFEATYISGAATSVSAGVPDVGLLTHEDFCRAIRACYDASGLPMIADADTGFGEAEMLRRVTIDYFRAGAAGLHVEDQQFPKRCGHLDGKALVAPDHMVEKVRWAAQAARDLAPPGAPPAMIVCARTDARGVEGFDASIERATAYCRAGAEMIFPEGLAAEDEFARFSASIKHRVPGVLLLANMTEFGKTPMIPLSRFASMGYHYVIYPVSLLRVAMGAVERALADFKQHEGFAGQLATMQDRKRLYELVGYTPGVPWEARAR